MTRPIWMVISLWVLMLVLVLAILPVQAQTQAQTQTSPNVDSQTMFQNVFGQRKTRSASKIAVPLKLDQNELGLVEIDLNSTPIRVSGRLIGKLLKNYLNVNVVSQLEQDPQWLWAELGELAKLGIRAEYSAQRISLDVTIDVALRLEKTLVIDQRRTQVTDSGLPIAEPEKYSLIWNSRLVQSWQADANANTQKGQWFSDLAFRAGDWVGELAGSVPTQSSAAFNRTHTRVSRDWLSNAVRLTLGDTSTGERSALSTQAMGGIRLSRLFSINPSMNVLSLPGDRLSLATGGAVDIDVNGYVVRTLRLDPGVYNLKDIYAFQGANDVSIRVVEPGGRMVTHRFDYFFDSALLATGISEWDVALGVPSRADQTGRRYDGSDRIGSAWWRTGLKNNLTGGAGLQALDGPGRRATVTQLEGVWMTRYGAWTSWLARSTREDMTLAAPLSQGQAQMLQWRTQTSHVPRAAWRASLTVQAAHTGRGYSALNSRLPAVASNDLGFRAGLSWGQDWSASAAASRRVSEDVTRNNRTVTFGLRRRLSKEWSAEGTLGQLQNVLLSTQVSTQNFVTIAVRYSPSDSDNSYVNQAYSSADKRFQTDVETKGALSLLDADAAWRVNATRRQNIQGEDYAVRTRLQTSRGEATWSSLQANDRVLDASRYHELTLAQAMVISRSGLRLTGPIYDSAVVFTPKPGFESYKVIVDPQRDRAAASSDRWGSPVLGDVFAYNPREVQLDLENLPAGRSLGADRYILSPRYRSVLDVSIGTDANTQISGELTNAQGAPMAMQTLRVIRLDAAAPAAATTATTSTSPIELFTNRRGHFLSQGLAPGRYQLVRLQDDAVLKQFDISPGQSGILILGSFTMKD